MKSREESILDQLTELCKVNESVHFDISIPILQDDGEGNLCFEEVSYSFKELKMKITDIEYLERHEKISIVEKYRFKRLKDTEFSRTTYSLFVPTKGEVIYGAPIENKWRPESIVGLIGGVFICTMAIIMIVNNTSIVGYDTYYGYHTLTPYGALFIGAFVLLFGIVTMPKKRR